MRPTYRARPGRLLALALASAAFVAAFGGGAAFAADPPQPQELSIEQIFQQLQDTPVYKDACTKTCHGNIATTSNYSSAIKFQHGFHQLVPCSGCHPRFPHRPDTTIERPTMKGCFNCHGVRHGPMGLVASSACEDCHITPKENLRPASHTTDWAKTPHVKPAKDAFNTECAMCHTATSCTECHDAEGIDWAPASWDYNAGDGCLACHGSATLSKQSQNGIKSFEVTGLTDSAHTEISCQECHPDYRYDDKQAASNVWSINAGQACSDCHASQKEQRLKAPVAEYDKSIHAQEIEKSNYDSATCASCHGGHYIYRLDSELAKQRMHMASYRVCARCKQHGDEYDTYDDYYHGKAYKSGTPDAPACWDCHNSHKILPKSSKESSVNPANVGDTCGQEGCHAGSDQQFGAAAAELIHSSVEKREQNPLMRIVSRLTGQ
jgi:hypothetical protein